MTATHPQSRPAHRCQTSATGRHRFVGSLCADCKREFMEIHADKLRFEYARQQEMPKDEELQNLIESGCSSRPLRANEQKSIHWDRFRWSIAGRDWKCGNCARTIKKGEPFTIQEFIDEHKHVRAHGCTVCEVFEWETFGPRNSFLPYPPHTIAPALVR